MKCKYLVPVIISVFIFSSCNQFNNNHDDENGHTTKIFPIAETDAVDAGTDDDAADDPAIWVNPENPSQSRIIGTNKKAGLHVYDLQGKNLYFAPVGLPNNVDVRDGFVLGEDTIVLVAASNRAFNGITLMRLHTENDSLSDISYDTIVCDVDEVYGFCLYQPKNSSQYYAIINGKDGQVLQYELTDTLSKYVKATLVRKLAVPSQPEGMVADDELGYLYVGEEAAGVWKFQAHPDSSNSGFLIEASKTEHSNMVPDIEGVALYKTDSVNGYLLASVQGNHTFAVFDRQNNQLLNIFRLAADSIDGAEETDGIDAVSDSLSPTYPNGMFVAQDGFNYNQDSVLVSQNFKYADFSDILRSIK